MVTRALDAQVNSADLNLEVERTDKQPAALLHQQLSGLREQRDGVMGWIAGGETVTLKHMFIALYKTFMN